MSRKKKLKLFARALIYGLFTATGAFAAIAAALSGQAGLNLTRNAYIWLAVGSLFPGIVAFLLERRVGQDRLDVASDRERNVRLEDAIDKQVMRADADRANTGRALSRIGGAIMDIIRAPDSDRTSEIARFEQLLVYYLWLTLDKRLESASRLRVMFLIRHGGYAKGQPEPQATDDGLMPIIYRARSRAGFNDDQIYTIRQGSPEEVFARRLLAREPGLKDGLLIEDVTKKTREECSLLPSDEGITSYCRMAVRDPVTHHGILCVDDWGPGSLDKGDREVIGAFAAVLAVGLTLGISYPSREIGHSQGPVIPSGGDEVHSDRVG